MTPEQSLQWRYATKNFDPNKNISDSDTKQLLDALRMSPSACNAQPWHFIVATSKESRAKIAEGDKLFFKDMYQRTMDASMAIVACVKTDLEDSYLQNLLEMEEKVGRYTDEKQKKELDHARRHSIELHRDKIKDFHPWLEHQLYLSVGMFLMTAANLSIDTLVYESIDWGVIRKEFSLDEKNLKLSLVLLAGYRASDDYNAPPARPKARWPEEEVFTFLG